MNKFVVLSLLAMLGLSACVPVEIPADDVTPNDSDAEVTDSADSSEDAEGETDVFALELRPFDQAAYEAALAEGKDVFLDVYASWCPTCRANEPVVEAALEGNTNANLVAFRVDFDNDKELLRELGVTSQSTYIFVPGGDLESRETTVGVLSEASLGNLLDS